MGRPEKQKWRFQPRFKSTFLTRNLGSWIFRVSREMSTDFFIHVILLLIGESLSDNIADRIDTLQKEDWFIEDDICGVSLSVRFSYNLVTVWNRLAPTSSPISMSPPLSSSSDSSEKGISPVEKGVETMKDMILSSLPKELKPHSWNYREGPSF